MIEIDKEFEAKLREIFYFVVRYGAVKEHSFNIKPEDFNYKRFISLCNEGFKIGQDMVLVELRNLVEKRKEIENKINEKRTEKEDKERRYLERVLYVHTYKI